MNIVTEHPINSERVQPNRGRRRGQWERRRIRTGGCTATLNTSSLQPPQWPGTPTFASLAYTSPAEHSGRKVTHHYSTQYSSPPCSPSEMWVRPVTCSSSFHRSPLCISRHWDLATPQKLPGAGSGLPTKISDTLSTLPFAHPARPFPVYQRGHHRKITMGTSIPRQQHFSTSMDLVAVAILSI